MADLAGKTVLITGAGSGIGRACALAFAREGARVVAVDLDSQAAAQTVAQLGGQGDVALPAVYHGLDVADEAAVRTCLAEILAHTGIDVLVNSAGIGATRPFLQTDAALFDRMMAVNLRGTFLCAQGVAQSMVDRGIAGSIVNIGSASGVRGNAGRTAYGAAKAAVVNLTQVMAIELAEHGIRVNAVAPGPIETPLVTAAHSTRTRKAWLAALPMARYGAVADVAQAVLYLAGDRATYVTGHVLHVDGGFQAAGILRG